MDQMRRIFVFLLLFTLFTFILFYSISSGGDSERFMCIFADCSSISGLSPLASAPASNLSKESTEANARTRALLLQSKCAKLRKRIETKLDYPPGTFNMSHVILEAKILADLERNFFFCKVPKSASTSWTNVLLAEYLTPGQLANLSFGFRHGMMRRVMTDVRSVDDFFTIRALQTSFLTARHPFDRLFSAYNDKFLKHPDQPGYSPDVEFRRFQTLYGKSIRGNSSSSRIASFGQFVDYVIGSHVGEDDTHWMPLFRLCLPCHLDYRFVAKVETSDRDSMLILRHLNLTSRPKALPSMHVLAKAKTSVAKMDAFSTLNRHQLDKLYQRYFIDFQLFDYDLAEFRHLFPNKKNSASPKMM